MLKVVTLHDAGRYQPRAMLEGVNFSLSIKVIYIYNESHK